MDRKRQEEIFSDWIKKYKSLFFKVIRIYAEAASDESDLFQEISIQVWNSIPKFKGKSKVSTWIYKIALNTAIKWSARSKTLPTSELSESNLIKPDEVQINERLEWLYAEIARLGRIDRSIALLMLEGFSYKEMSEMIGISTNLVGVKINRIKKHLIEKSKINIL